jgi:hypothetical protein
MRDSAHNVSMVSNQGDEQMTTQQINHNGWAVNVYEGENGWYAIAGHDKYGEIDTRDAMPNRATSAEAMTAIIDWADDVSADPALQ